MEKYADYIITTGRKAYHKYLGLGLTGITLCEDEFISAAAIGVAKAFKKFNPSRATNLRSYAFPYIKQEVRFLLTDKMEHNKNNRELNEAIKSDVVSKKPWPKFMCMADLLAVFGHILDDGEKSIICYKYCDNLSDFKIAKKLGVQPSTITRVARSAHSKIRGEVLRHGDVEDIQDIRCNIMKVFANRASQIMFQKIKDDNPDQDMLS